MSTDDDFAWGDPRELPTRAPFSTLFPIREDLRGKIAKSMRENGFDPSKPINVWRQENVVVDGHTRREAAVEARVEVLVCFHDFKDEDEAMEYAIANQRDRRNLSDAELASLILAVDERKKKGRPDGVRQIGALNGQDSDELMHLPGDRDHGRSSQDTAEKIGLSSRYKVDQVRAIDSYANETGDTVEKEAILGGTMTINEASRRVREKRRDQSVSPKTLEAAAWLEENGNPPIDRAVSESGYSRGTLHKARVHLGLSDPAREKTRKDKDRKAYGSVDLGHGNGRAIERREIVGQIEGYNEEWLIGLPARDALERTKAFDADALIVRECKPLLREIKDRIERLIGHRSPAGMSSVHRALHRVFDLPDPENWPICGKCKGSGRHELVACGACKGGGYVIPNFTKGTS